MKINRYLLGSTLVAALGGFLFGFDTAVISGATEALRKVFGLTSNELGFTVASALIGTVLGSGRRTPCGKAGPQSRTEMAGGFLFCLRRRLCLGLELVCFAALPFPGGIGHWRGLRGIPHVYCRDFARRETRPISGRQPAEYCAGNSGRLFFQLRHCRTAQYWHNRGMALDVGSGGHSGCFVFPVPFADSRESPLAGETTPAREARIILDRLGNPNTEAVLQEIVDSLHEETVSAFEPFFQKKYYRPILLAFMVATFNQLSGINALIYYTADIFRMAGAANRALFFSL